MRKTLSFILLMSSPALAGTVDAPVVGGHAATLGEWPEVALVVAPQALCTGTLVASDVVLTAGHCIDTHPFEVLIGTVDYAHPGGEKIAVASAVAYPDWQHAYDVGVLVLAHPATAKPRAIAGACTIREHLTGGARVQLVGFGLTTASGTGDNSKLNEAMLAVTDARCTESPACNTAIAPDGEFAAGGRGTDSCFGDSGGPIYVPTAHGAALAGVVSRGLGTQGAPCGGGGVYERADKVVKWIEQTTHRTLARTVCDSKADEQAGDGDAEAGGGCSAGGGLAGGALLALAGLGMLARRREARLR
ncbi:MAG: S1 family peptidase [Acidobacteriota bacterium]